MSSESMMILDLPMKEAKALRQRYGDAKYTTGLRHATDFLVEAYVEAVDISNYIDLAREAGQIDEDRHAELQGLLHSGVLSPLRRTIVRKL